MDYTLIETAAYERLLSLVLRLSERSIALSRISMRRTSDRWMTTDEVCKALHMSKRTLNYYRQQRQVPYTMLEKKVYYRESDIHGILTSNLVLPPKR